MLLTTNYNLQKPQPADNLKASQGYLATSFDLIDSRMKTNANDIASLMSSVALKADKLSPTFTPSAVGAVGVTVQGVLGQTGNLAEFKDSDGLVHVRVSGSGSLVLSGNSTTRAVFASDLGIPGRFSVNPRATNDQGIVVRGLSGQTANLFEAQNSSGSVLVRINAGGRLLVAPDGNGEATFAGAEIHPVSNGNPGLAIIGNAAPASPGIIVRGAASQTANLAEFQNTGGTVLANVRPAGGVVAAGLTANEIDTPLGSTLYVVGPNRAPGNAVAIIRGAASQSANLAEFQNSAGTVLASVDNGGRLTYTTAGGNVSANVGGAPVIAFLVTVDGVQRRVLAY